MWFNRLLTAFLLSGFVSSGSCYCTPSQSCWPEKAEWDTLSTNLEGKLTKLNPSGYEQCFTHGTDARGISGEGEGICMHAHNCRHEFCAGKGVEDIPAYSAEIKSVEDIQAALDFANRYDIAVTIKTTGHSYSGSSSGKDTLMLWMANFPKASRVLSTFNDSCGVVTENVLAVNGGETWESAYTAVGSDFHLVGGGGLTVSAAGGWLMGGGLSALSRLHGIGVDNVLAFDLVLANTTHVSVDACSFPDLFWALRGGGGGSFGVVTSVRYKLHPVTNVTLFTLTILPPDLENPEDLGVFLYLVNRFIDQWVDVSPHLDRRWGGYWGLNFFILYYQGSNNDDVQSTFIDDMEAWKASLGPIGERIVLLVRPFPSYWDSRGRGATTDPTGQEFNDIASRLIPRDFVVNNGTAAKNMLKFLANHGFGLFNYFLGGAVADVAPTATAVHPALREAIWQIETFGGGRFNSEFMMAHIRSQVPDSGSGYNHGKRNEPDWRNAFWGSNYEKLETIKAQFDPDNRFNCWHCVGYVGAEAALDEPRDDVGLTGENPAPSEDATWAWVVLSIAAILLIGIVILSVRH